MATDPLPSQGDTATRIDWSEGTPTALCDDDHCAWKHRGVSTSTTQSEARKHVRATGHSVTVFIERRLKVVPS